MVGVLLIVAIFMLFAGWLLSEPPKKGKHKK